MATTQYVFLADLEIYLTPKKVKALTDDNQDGTSDPTPVNQICIYASAEAESWVQPEYQSLFPFPSSTPIPDLLKQLALLFACAQLFERHPEYVKKYGEEKRAEGWRQRAERLGQQLQSHVRAFADLTLQAANDGGVVVAPGPSLLMDPVSGEYTGGDF